MHKIDEKALNRMEEALMEELDTHLKEDWKPIIRSYLLAAAQEAEELLGEKA